MGRNGNSRRFHFNVGVWSGTWIAILPIYTQCAHVLYACVCVCVYLYANGFPFPSGIQYPVRVCKKRLNTNSRDQHWLASWQAGNKRINHRIGDEEIRQRQHELNKTEYMRGNETERRLAPQLVTCHYIDIIVKVTYGGGNISCSSQ